MKENESTPKFSMSDEGANAKILSKAIILVAGKSTRTFPLTVTKPKALLKVANRTMLSVLLDNLQGIVKEAILVVNYKKEMIEHEFGAAYKDIKLTYVVQKETKGTGDALLAAEPVVTNAADNEFLVIGGDDYFTAEDLASLAKQKCAVLSQEVENPSLYGVLHINEKSELIAIEEKPAKPKSKLVNTGAYVLPKEIFQLLKKIKKTQRGEYELTDAVVLLKDKPVVVKGNGWLPVTYPWHLLDVNKRLLAQIKFKSDGKIEPGVTIHGAVQVGKGTIIKSGAYIEGPVLIGQNCTIGPNCYIRGETTLGDGAKIGNAVEVKNSIVGNKTSIGHLSYVGDSIIGDHVNFGAGTIVANLKHDDSTIKSHVGKELVDSGRRKLGTIIGDNVHTGVHSSIYPGRKLWPNTTTAPGEIVKYDKQF